MYRHRQTHGGNADTDTDTNTCTNTSTSTDAGIDKDIDTDTNTDSDTSTVTGTDTALASTIAAVHKARKSRQEAKEKKALADADHAKERHSAASTIQLCGGFVKHDLM